MFTPETPINNDIVSTKPVIDTGEQTNNTDDFTLGEACNLGNTDCDSCQ